jgi:hypothetical protein
MPEGSGKSENGEGEDALTHATESRSGANGSKGAHTPLGGVMSTRRATVMRD